MNNNRLWEEKVSKLLLSLALPAICAHLITLFYNLVDRIFIGRMEDGVLAMGAIGICAPIVTIINAFAELLGAGGAPFAAIHIGSGDDKGAERYLGNSFSVLTAVSILITILVLSLKRPLLVLFGASERMLPYAVPYITIYCIGTLFIQLTVGLNYYITTQGFAKTAMITTMLGGILNMVLDPVFIFLLEMGIQGAALATVLSQMASFIWVVYFLFNKKPKLRLRLENMKIDTSVLKEILVLGSAPFFMSVSQGAQPIIGQNYGAGRFDRVRETIKLAAFIN